MAEPAPAAPTVTLFVVFHQKVFRDLLRDLPVADRSSVVLYGVNEKIAKELPDTENDPDFVGYRLVLEPTLKTYDPYWQAASYCQTSCIQIVHSEGLHLGADYVGMAQYDMQLRPDTISHIREKVARHPGVRWIFYELAQPLAQALQIGHEAWDGVLADYNAFFGTSWSWQHILRHPRVAAFCPLLHTFVMPCEMYDRMISWTRSYFSRIRETRAYPTRASQAEFSERVFGLFFALEMFNADVVAEKMHLDHKWPMYHDQVPFAGYKERVAEPASVAQ